MQLSAYPQNASVSLVPPILITALQDNDSASFFVLFPLSTSVYQLAQYWSRIIIWLCLQFLLEYRLFPCRVRRVQPAACRLLPSLPILSSISSSRWSKLISYHLFWILNGDTELRMMIFNELTRRFRCTAKTEAWPRAVVPTWAVWPMRNKLDLIWHYSVTSSCFADIDNIPFILSWLEKTKCCGSSCPLRRLQPSFSWGRVEAWRLFAGVQLLIISLGLVAPSVRISSRL